jgi:esterase/lipase superfamily enzyme
MAAIFDGEMLPAVVLCAVAMAAASIVLYRWTATWKPGIRLAANLVPPALLLGAAIFAAIVRAPTPPREAHDIPHRLAWTAQAATRLIENTRQYQPDPVVTGTLRPREPGGIVERSPPPDRRDVVQVFYGTDRARTDKPNRIAYGIDRARRLELGRAFVTIPTANQARSTARPWSIKRPYLSVTRLDAVEDARTHFAVSQIGALTFGEMRDLVAERLSASKDYKGHALVFIHGYNNDFDHALYRAAQIAYDLKFDGAPFMYSWPSGGSFTTYTYDRDSAMQAEPYLRDFIELVVEDSGARHISLIAHGMGSEPLLRVLRDLRRSSTGAPRIHQLILAAPDVDRAAFETQAAQIKAVSKGITLYASSNDLALGVARRFAGDIARAGDVAEGGPLIVPGIDTIDISALDTAFFAMNHATYAEQSALLLDFERLLLSGIRPPNRRLPILRRITGPSGDHWRYP